MSTLGIIPDTVRQSVQNVNSAYEQLVGVMCNSVQSNFVNYMATQWWSNDAVSYFNVTFKPLIDANLKDVYNIFSSVVSSMEKAAVEYASDVYSSVGFSGVLKLIDTDCITATRNDGAVGITDQAAANASKILDNLRISISDALGKATGAVANSGFQDETASTYLTNSLNTVKNNVTTNFDNLIAAANNAISSTVSQYKVITSNAENSFSGQ